MAFVLFFEKFMAKLFPSSFIAFLRHQIALVLIMKYFRQLKFSRLALRKFVKFGGKSSIVLLCTSHQREFSRKVSSELLYSLNQSQNDTKLNP